MIIYSINVEHFHPDDGKRSDAHIRHVIATTNEEAHSLLRPSYGEAWRFTTLAKQVPTVGVIL